MIQRHLNDNDVLQNRNCVQSDVFKSSLERKRSFRLQSDSGSIAGDSCFGKYDFKQRIDSMFAETRSAILESNSDQETRFNRRTQSECNPNGNTSFESATFNKNKHIKNMVQAKIEEMFADVSLSEIGHKDVTSGAQQFQVDYIGSLPLLNKVATLEGLQEPLKNLYFNFRKNKYSSSKLQALLEISSDGLKVQNIKPNKEIDGIKEQLNPFASIAVWAALKFVCRPQENGKFGLEYAFLPIIVDQKSTEKACLFRALNENDISCAIEKTYDDHSPLFVVVMRQSGTNNNRLLCHGFACSTSEDAVVLAANLYKTLVATMNNCHSTNACNNKKKIKCLNGLGMVSSIAGSSICDEQDLGKKSSQPNKNLMKNLTPPRPPRKNKVVSNEDNIKTCNEITSIIKVDPNEIISKDCNNMENNNVTLDSIDEIEICEKSNNMNINKIENKMSSISSWRSDKTDCGDIFTKVVIPRSKSFLNAPGALGGRYNRSNLNSYPDGINTRESTLHSPLGFIELFNELRIHEGLNNIDEILNTIIDVDGMSFDGLKPIYKEFIFKLAVTLTKDELYQRSKLIMQKQKRRKKKLVYNKKRFLSSYRMRKVLHMSMWKVRPSKYKISFPFVSYLLPSKCKGDSKFKPKIKLSRQNATLTSLSNSSSIYGFNRLRRKSFKSRKSTDMHRDKVLFSKKHEISLHRQTIFSNSRMQNIPFNSVYHIKHLLEEKNASLLIGDDHNSMSSQELENVFGYVTRSECSYNSELCKYRTFQKCYCSMKNKHGTCKMGKLAHLSSVSSCSCDTDSCIESEKCYCTQNKKPSIFEQLKQQGFAASESSMSRSNSPAAVWQRTSDSNYQKKEKNCLQTSKSLEFVHVNNCQVKNTKPNINSGKYFENKHMFPFTKNQSLFNDANYTDDSNDDILSTTVKANYINFQGSIDCNYEITNNYASKFDAPESNSNENNIDSDQFDSNNNNTVKHNTILVVSTRDQKGNVKNSVTPFYNKGKGSPFYKPLKCLKAENVVENDAISIKKTAEIAALFSDMKVDKKQHTDKDFFHNSLNTFEGESLLNRIGSSRMKTINLENSLGYFP